MLSRNSKFKIFFIGVFFLFSFSLVLNASVSLNNYPQIKSSWDDGELTIAIKKLQEEVKKRSQNSDMVELLKKLIFQKKKFDEWLLKANDLLKQNKFKEAAEILSFIKEINPNYVHYIELMNKINIAEMETKYPKKVIFNGKSFGINLKPCEIDGKFTKYAKFEKSLLKVNYPKGYGWGRVGVESNSTVLNFDNNSSNVSSTLTFKFDPEETTGFEVDLDGVNIKSQSFSKISVIYGRTDKNNSILELHKDGSLQSKLDMGNKAP
jgi:hypothetical protein